MANSSHNDNTNKITAWNVKEPTKVPNNNMQGRVNIDYKKFDLFVKQQGSRIKVYRTMYCPNVKSIDGAEHPIDCEVPGCNGSGFLDRHPIETKAVITNQGLEKIQMKEGFTDGNTVSMTFLTGIELQYFTLIELMDYTDIYFERIKRSISNVDVLKYAAKRVNMIIDRHNIEYYEGIDFSIDPNGNIRWAVGRGPDVDVIYSIHYEAAVQFRAVRSMHSNRFSQYKEGDQISYMKINENWACTKEFLVKRIDLDGNEILPNRYSDYEE